MKRIGAKNVKAAKAVKIVIMLFLLGIIISAPLLLYKGVKFTGTDDRTGIIISEIKPEYKPWFGPVFKPGTGTENMLFMLQAAIGLGFIIFYILWAFKKRKVRE